MGLITTIIPRQSFEIIHDKIGEILKLELDQQYVLTYDPDFQAEIWKERDIPFNDSEISFNGAINITLQEGDFEGRLQTMSQQNGEYKYVIEVIFNGKSKDGKLGDTIAMTRVQKVIGVIRAILMSPKYVTVGFPKGMIEHRRVSGFMFGKPVRQDSSHTCLGRLMFCVRAADGWDFSPYDIANGTDAIVKLALTELGYKYTSDFYLGH